MIKRLISFRSIDYGLMKVHHGSQSSVALKRFPEPFNGSSLVQDAPPSWRRPGAGPEDHDRCWRGWIPEPSCRCGRRRVRVLLSGAVRKRQILSSQNLLAAPGTDRLHAAQHYCTQSRRRSPERLQEPEGSALEPAGLSQNQQKQQQNHPNEPDSDLRPHHRAAIDPSIDLLETAGSIRAAQHARECTHTCTHLEFM